MDHLKDFVERDLFARYLGVEFLQYGDGYAKARLEINKNHLNSVETVHGGVVFSLADAVFSAASNSRRNVAVAIQVALHLPDGRHNAYKLLIRCSPTPKNPPVLSPTGRFAPRRPDSLQ